MRRVSVLPLAVMALLTAAPAVAQNTASQRLENRLFETGQTLLQHKALGGARHLFHAFLETAPPTDPRAEEARYYEAFCALTLYQLDAEKIALQGIAKKPYSPLAAETYYDIAHFYYTQQAYQKALPYFEKIDFSALDKERFISGHFYWGYSLFNLRKLDAARVQFNFVKRLETRFAPAASYYAGFIALNDHRPDEALEDLQRAEKSASYAPLVPYMIASLYFQQKQYAQLLRYVDTLDRAALLNERQIALLVAETYFNRRDYASALSEYQRYLEGGRAGHAESAVLFRAGFASYLTASYDEASRYLTRAALSADSIGFYASYYLGAAYLRQGKKPLALNAFEKAKKYPSDPLMSEESSYQSAKILYDIERYDEALEEGRRFVKTYPQSPRLNEVKGLLSQIYLNAANYDKAISYISSLSERTAELDKVYQRATWLKGMELFNREDYSGALGFFEQSLQYPLDKLQAAETSFWSGEAYAIERQYRQAVTAYKKALTLTPDNDKDLTVKIRYGLGYALMGLKKYQEALPNFRSFVENGTKNPRYPDGLLRLADCYYVAKSYADALSYYQRYAALGAVENDYALLQIGIVKGILQRYDQADAAFAQAIKAYPGSRWMNEILFQRAQLQFEQGHYATAIPQFTALIARAPSSRFAPYAYLRRAASYYNQKRYKETVADYVTVLEKYTAHPAAKNALLPLQEALSLIGEGRQFDRYLARYKRMNPHEKEVESIEFEAAKNLYFNQKYKEAIARFERYLSAYPTGARRTLALYYQAEAYYRLQDSSRAVKAYRQVMADSSFLFAPKVVSRMAEITYGLGAYSQAVAYFRRLAKEAPTQEAQTKAWAGMMKSYFALEKYDSSDRYALRILSEETAADHWESQASLFLGKNALARKDYETAKDEFLNTINIARDQYGAEAKYLLGEVFFRSQDHRQCYHTLVDLNRDFAPYTEWVGKSFLLLSDNFVATGDLFQAEATLQSLVKQFPLAGIRAQAKQKLEELQKRVAERSSVALENDTLSLDP